LGVKLTGESSDLILVYSQTGGTIELACGVVFKILFGWFGIGHFSPELSLERALSPN
jgi:hypothetical protein